MDRDLLHPTLERERQSHKLKRLVPAPNSYFMDVKCGGCNETAVVFSHAQTVVACNNCKNILSKPTGGKCKLTEGSAFKVKAWSIPMILHILTSQLSSSDAEDKIEGGGIWGYRCLKLGRRWDGLMIGFIGKKLCSLIRIEGDIQSN